MQQVPPEPSPLAALKNVGPVTARRLNDVGIQTVADLEALGPVEAYRHVKTAYPRDTTLICLYALQGALWDMHWSALPGEVKSNLRAQARASARRRSADA